jgi:hypothetical protein
MALEGSLREFGLADILQLMMFQRKTGALALQRRKDRARLLFHDGNIVEGSVTAADSKIKGIDRLGRMLIGQKVISQESLDTALGFQKEKGGRLGSILVQEGLATAEQIQKVLSFQIIETMVQLFSWKEGKYEFTPQAVPVDKDVPFSMSTEYLLMEGLRFVDEWSTIKDRISFDTVFVKNEGYDGETAEEEEGILDLIDGENDVRAISDLTGVDSFQVSKSLLGLLDRGAIEEKLKEEVAEVKAPSRKRGPIQIRGLGFVFTALVLAALAISIAAAVMNTENRLLEFKASDSIDTLRLKIEAYRIEKRTYPSSLDAPDPWGNPYIYEAEGGRFTLGSAGPDGAPGTPDDIY